MPIKITDTLMSSTLTSATATYRTGPDGDGWAVSWLPGKLLDLDRISAYLVRTGESVNVAGDAKIAKVHVHNGRPDLVVRHALRLGRIVNATVVPGVAPSWRHSTIAR